MTITITRSEFSSEGGLIDLLHKKGIITGDQLADFLGACVEEAKERLGEQITIEGFTFDDEEE